MKIRLFRSAIIFLVTLLIFTFPSVLYAASVPQLKSTELNFGGLKPNENITNAINRFKKTYKVDVSSMKDQGINDYVTGDPTPSMAWFMSMTPDKEGRLINIVYEHFKPEKKGISNINIKGIKIGSGISSVHKVFGKNPVIKRTKQPPYSYIDMSYILRIQETGQSITVTFSLRHPTGQKETQAKVYGLSYKLQPLQNVPKKQSNSTSASTDTKGWMVNGKRITVGMTQAQVRSLIGEPTQIGRAGRSTMSEQERLYVLQNYPKEVYEMVVETENWGYNFSFVGRGSGLAMVTFVYGKVTSVIASN